MKNNLLLLLLISTSILGCRKKTPLEIPGQAEVVDYTCVNGIMDAGEDGIDCGSNCTPCMLSLADCGLPLIDNQFYAGSNTFASSTTNFSAGQIVASTSTGVLVLTATSGGKYVKITFSSANPTIFASYNTLEFGTLSSNDARVEFYLAPYLFTGYTSTIHLNKIAGKYEIEFCDVYMSCPSLGGYYVADGKLTEN